MLNTLGCEKIDSVKLIPGKISLLAPYQMVKDLRTDFEVGNPSAVLDGDLDGFIEAGIKWRKERE